MGGYCGAGALFGGLLSIPSGMIIRFQFLCILKISVSVPFLVCSNLSHIQISISTTVIIYNVGFVQQIICFVLTQYLQPPLPLRCFSEWKTTSTTIIGIMGLTSLFSGMPLAYGICSYHLCLCNWDLVIGALTACEILIVKSASPCEAWESSCAWNVWKLLDDFGVRVI